MKTFRIDVENWMLGINSEINFWDAVLNASDKTSEPMFTIIFDPSAPYKFIDLVKLYDNPAILDVGSGITSTCGSYYEGKKLNFRSCDPLATCYALLLKKAGVTPHCQSEFAFGEKLTDRFAEESFDIVTMSNALDHSFNPLQCLLELLRVCKIGGTVRITSRENEAIFEHWQGFHQWNINGENNKFIISNRNQSLDINEIISSFASIAICRVPTVENGSFHLTIDIRKIDAVPNIIHTGFSPAEFDEILFDTFLKHISSFYMNVSRTYSPGTSIILRPIRYNPLRRWISQAGLRWGKNRIYTYIRRVVKDMLYKK